MACCQAVPTRSGSVGYCRTMNADSSMVTSAVPAPVPLPDFPPPETMRRDLEALLLVSPAPVTAAALAAALGLHEELVEGVLRSLATEYAEANRGFVLRPAVGGWRLYSHPDAAEAIQALLGGPRRGRLSRPALETLAIIAYRQPVSRQEIAQIRNVNPDGVVRTLIGHGLVEEAGEEDEEGGSSATRYVTTTGFLEQLGLETLEALPPLHEHLPGEGLLDEFGEWLSEPGESELGESELEEHASDARD